MLEEYIKGAAEEKWAGHPRIRTSREEMHPEAGTVTPEMLERRNFRMNKPFIPSGIYFNNEATVDTIRHYFDGIGDTNPLFRDATYARKSQYGRIIVPGTFLFTHQWTAIGSGLTGGNGWMYGQPTGTVTQRQKEAMRAGLRAAGITPWESEEEFYIGRLNYEKGAGYKF